MTYQNFSDLSDEQAISAAWDQGDQQSRDLARRLERLNAQIKGMSRRWDDAIGGEPVPDSMFHVKQAN